MGPVWALCALAMAAGANEAAQKVDQQFTQPALNEVQQAAGNLANPNAPAMTPSWGAWAARPYPPAVQRLLDLFERDIVGPWYDQTSTSAGSVARVLASKDPNATTQVPDPSFPSLSELLGISAEDKTQLPVRPPPKPKKEKRKDSIGLVRRP